MQFTALSGILDLSNYPLPLSPFNFPSNSITETVVRRFGIKVRSVENSIALQERARYILRLNLISQPEDSSFLYTNRDIHLSITDPDSKLIIYCTKYWWWVIVGQTELTF